MLDGLKVYLSVPNCVFVAAMNQQLVVDAVAQRFRRESTSAGGELELGLSEIRAEAYLEKICNDVERLVPPRSAANLFKAWLPERIAVRTLDALIDQDGNEIRCLPPNPRRLKSLANVYHRLTEQLSENDLENRQVIRSLIVCAYTYRFHAELFQRLEFTPDLFRLLCRWIDGEVSTNPDGQSPIAGQLPGFLRALRLPEEVAQIDEAGPVRKTHARSSFPDPYATNMYWIAPLIRVSRITQDDIEFVLPLFREKRT